MMTPSPSTKGTSHYPPALSPLTTAVAAGGASHSGRGQQQAQYPTRACQIPEQCASVELDPKAWSHLFDQEVW